MRHSSSKTLFVVSNFSKLNWSKEQDEFAILLTTKNIVSKSFLHETREKRRPCVLRPRRILFRNTELSHEYYVNGIPWYIHGLSRQGKRREIMRRNVLTLVLAASCVLPGCVNRPTQTASVPPAAQEQDVSSTQSQDSQELPRVSYLGPEGTYTQEACDRFFEGKGTYLPQVDVTASVEALLNGTSDYAVIPQENTIGGPVGEYLDQVLLQDAVSVVGEVELPISQNLLAKPQSKLEDITVVYSHKQGIAQGKEWMAANLPDAELVEVSSTAEGAKMAAEAEGLNCAAIGSAAAAKVYGLEVLASDIQMNDANKTRFYVLSLEKPAKEASDRMAFIAAGDAQGLPDLLELVEEQGLKVVAVHDRPEKTDLGRYEYLIECSGGGYEAFEALEQDKDFKLRYLGSFPLR